MKGFNQTVASVSSNNSVQSIINDVTTISTFTTTQSTSSSISGRIGTSTTDNYVALTLTGSGTLTLGRTDSTYRGATTISNGTLSVAQVANALASSSIGRGDSVPTVTIGSALTSGTLQYTGAGHSTNRAVLLGGAGGGELRFVLEDGGVSNRVLGTTVATFDGLFRIDQSALTKSSGSWTLVDTASLSEWYGGTFGLAFVGGPTFTDNLNGTYSSGAWTYDIGTGVLSIPEPGSLALLGIGMLALTRRQRRA